MDPDELAAYVERTVDETERAAEAAFPDGVIERTPHQVFDECRALRYLLAWRAKCREEWLRKVHEKRSPESNDDRYHATLARAHGRALAADEALAVYAREAYRNRDDWPAG